MLKPCEGCGEGGQLMAVANLCRVAVYTTKQNRISVYSYHMSRTMAAKKFLKIFLNKYFFLK